jgi:hypothetical protein
MRRGLGIAGVLLALAIPGCRRAPASSPEARATLDVLNQILASKNDNDPRLDTAFNALTPETKVLFRRRYAELAPERRNERGTIVFLLGKNLTEADDWAFLAQVAAEPRCLSLADCGKPSRGDAEPGDAVTLAYPALVSLTLVGDALRRRSNPVSAADVWGVVKAAQGSQDPKVARKAAALQAEFAPLSGK